VLYAHLANSKEFPRVLLAKLKPRSCTQGPGASPFKDTNQTRSRADLSRESKIAVPYRKNSMCKREVGCVDVNACCSFSYGFYSMCTLQRTTGNLQLVLDFRNATAPRNLGE
jgi:hypothetical protein